MTPTFLQHPTHYTLAEFRTMLAGVQLGAWRPRFPTLHNTGVPSLKQWLAYGPTPQELAVFLKAEMDKWGPVIREAKIKAEE